MNNSKNPWSSVVETISKVKPFDRTPMYLFVPFAPFALFVTQLIKEWKENNTNTRFFGITISNNIFGIFVRLSCWGMTLLGIGINHKYIGKILLANIASSWQTAPWWMPVFLGIVATYLINMSLHLLLLLLDIPDLLRSTLYASSAKAVSQWACTLHGYDIWNGRTNRLIEDLVTRKSGLGKAGDLLVRFIRDDLERKVQNSVQRDSEEGWIYKVTVNDWDARTYSRFLAANIAVAEKSILWLVDPRDFLTQLLPAHIFEVILSVGCVFDSEVDDILKRLRETERGINPLALLNAIHRDCSQPCAGNSECLLPSQQREGRDWQQILYFHRTSLASKKRRMYESDHILTVLFCHTLQILGTNINGAPCFISDGTSIKETISSKTMGLQSVLHEYQQRVSQGLATRLDHIEAFRKAPCRVKRRHIFAGTYRGARLTPDILQEQCAENIKSMLDGIISYIDNIVPVPRSSLDINTIDDSCGLVDSWSLLENGTEETISKIPAIRVRSAGENREFTDKIQGFWKNISPEVRRLLLDFALELFAHTSDGKENVAAVFDSKDLTDYDRQRAYDRGVYDERIEVMSSELSTPDNSDPRSVKWCVFGEDRISPTTSLFKGPEFESNHIDFDRFKIACMSVLDK